MPVGDWQFWVVTAAAALGLLVMIRTLRGRRPRPRRTDLTIAGRKPRAARATRADRDR